MTARRTADGSYSSLAGFVPPMGPPAPREWLHSSHIPRRNNVGVRMSLCSVLFPACLDLQPIFVDKVF